MKSSRANLRILLCPNAFKGSLTAPEAARAMAAGIRRLASEPIFSGLSEIETRSSSAGGRRGRNAGNAGLPRRRAKFSRQRVQNPLGQPTAARWGRLGGAQKDTAVIEMAEAAGLRLLTPAQYDPENATTYGVGQLMRIALEAGCRTLDSRHRRQRDQ